MRGSDIGSHIGADFGGAFRTIHSLKNNSKTNKIAARHRVQPEIADVQPKAEHVGFLDLRYRQCRWPYGEGPFTFCGCRTQTELGPYCREHHVLAHEVVE